MFQCLECKKTFSNVNILEDHVEEEHKGSQPYLKLQHSNDEDIALIADNKNIVDSMDKCSEYDEKAWTDHENKVQGISFTGKSKTFAKAVKETKDLMAVKDVEKTVNGINFKYVD